MRWTLPGLIVQSCWLTRRDEALEGCRVGVGGLDGERYLHIISIFQGGGWMETG